jgi:hypothetical protein
VRAGACRAWRAEEGRGRFVRTARGLTGPGPAQESTLAQNKLNKVSVCNHLPHGHIHTSHERPVHLTDSGISYVSSVCV